jgi:hypothetical protein
MHSAAPAHASSEMSQWAVGITTAPREIPTLEATLASVSRAGFTEVQLFAEPDTPLPSRKSDHSLHVSISQRGTTLGAFPNWYVQ